MSQKSAPLNPKPSAERVVRDIRRATRRHYSAEDKIRIVLEGLDQPSRVPISAHSVPTVRGTTCSDAPTPDRATAHHTHPHTPGLNHPPRQSTAPTPKSNTTLISTPSTPWIGPVATCGPVAPSRNP